MKRMSAWAPSRWIAMLVLLGLPGLGATLLAQRDLGSYRDPYGRFALQHPRDWLVLPGAGNTLLTLAEKRGRATIQIEYLKLNQPLDVAQARDLIVQIESDLIRERQPRVSEINALPAESALPAVVTVEFVRPGLQGPEWIRQFSVVRGADLFRILCLAPTAEFRRFEPMFKQVVRSFTIATASEE